MNKIKDKVTEFWNEVDLCHVSPAKNGIRNEYSIAVEETIKAFKNVKSLEEVVEQMVEYYSGSLDDDKINIIVANLKALKDETQRP